MTPAPWRFAPGSASGEFEVRGKGNGLVAIVWSGITRRAPFEKLEAAARKNAEAITTLPDLIATLKEMTALVSDVLVDGEPPNAPVAQMVERARALIARAEQA